MLTNWCYSNKHVDVTAGSKPPSFYHIQKVETTYAFVYTYIFLNRTCWVHIVLRVCMVSGLTVWRWAISWCTEDRLSHSQLSSAACSSQASPHAVWHAHWCPPCSPRVRAVMGWDLMGAASDVTGDTVSQQTLILRPWQSFRPSSAMFPEPLGQQCFIDGPIRHSNGNPNEDLSLYRN